MNNVTGFQRARRLAAEAAKKAAEAAESPDNTNTPVNTVKPNTGESDPSAMTLEEIETADIEDIKKLLDVYGIKYAHNTGENKLREKLADAIK